MQVQPPPPLIVASLRGGYNDTDPVNLLREDECALAQNAEFFLSADGERRAGCDPIDVTTAGFNGAANLTVAAPSPTSWGVIGVTLAPNGIIVFDNSLNGGFGASVSTYTAAYTVGATANYLLVGVVGDATTDKVTGVTYNGVAMTLLKKYNSGISWIYLYGLASPTTGSHNVVISASGSCSALGFLAESFGNMSAAQPDSSTTFAVAGSASVATAFTPVAKNAWAVQFSFNLQGQPTSMTGGVVRAFGTIAGPAATLSWTGTTSGSQNYGSTTTPLRFEAGTYTLSVSNGTLNVTFKGASGGAGGGFGNNGAGACGTNGLTNGGSGGAGGGATFGTSVSLVPGHSYVLTVGAGGVGGDFANSINPTSGGNTTLVDVTAGTTLVSITGGSVGGAGGSVIVGSNGVTGGSPGGNGTYTTTVGTTAGGTGGTTGATGGGGGGGAGNMNDCDGTPDRPGGAGGGGASTSGGSGGSAGVLGAGSGGASSGSGGGAGTSAAGGGGGGGGVKFGVAGELANGYGGGGGGGAGLGHNGSGSQGVGGAGGPGVGELFFQSGVTSYSATLGDTNGPVLSQSTITHLSEWFPLNDAVNSELWAVAAVPNDSTSAAMSRRSSVPTGTPEWYGVTPVDPIVTASPDIYRLQSQALDGLLFWAYTSGVDRLHVWEPSTQTLRRTGLAQPGAPSAANGGGAGSYTATLRYYRMRVIQKNGAVIVRRSEPSTSVSFTPDGAHAAAVVMQGTLVNEGETHWEVEVSLDNKTFYLLATVAIGTTTYSDSAATTSYSSNVQSDSIGAYLLQPAARFVGTDGDHLVWAGHTFDPSRASTIGWSPIGSDPGVGNAERQPIVQTGGTATTNTLTLDNFVGGPITGIATGFVQPVAYTTSSPVTVWFVFKWERIYMISSTGVSTQAYTALCLSATNGAIPGSVFRGVDEMGQPCVYFLDPMLGPSRLTLTGGIEPLKGLRKTWKRVNLYAKDVIACGTYYPYKRQALWWVSVDGGDTPELRIRYQVFDGTENTGGRGWSMDTGRIAEARCAGIYTEFVQDGSSVTLSKRPVIGLTSPDFIQRCDVNSTDAGQSFNTIIMSSPRTPGSLLRKFGIMAGTILTTAAAGVNVVVRLIRNYGLDESDAQMVSCTPTSTETEVITELDDLKISEAHAVQIMFSDI